MPLRWYSAASLTKGISDMSMMQQFRNMEAQFAGTAVGALAGLLSSWSENRDAHDSRRDGDYKFLRDSVEALKVQVQSQAHQPQPFQDFRDGILSGVYVDQNGIMTPAARPPLWTSTEEFNYPPEVTTRNSQGLITKVGEMARFGHRLDLPEVRAALTGMQMPGFVSAVDLGKIVALFNAVMTSAIGMGVAPVQPLIPQQLAALAAQIAADSGSKAAVNNLFTALLSQAGQAVMGGIGSVGTLTGAQTALLVNYFNALVGSIIAAGGSTAVAAWIASASPALADPALDAAWGFTFSSSTLLGQPTNTTSGTLGAVVVNTAVVATVAFGFIADASEQQTARRFRVAVSNLSTAAAGQAARFYLPKALTGGTAPKVTVGVEGNTWAQAGSPYIKNPTGGSTPYFDLYVIAGTNSASWNAIIEVSR